MARISVKRELPMRYAIPVAAVLLAGTTPVVAGGIDRSGQFLGPLWEPGNYGELSFGYVKPEIDGNDVALFGGRGTGNAAESYSQLGLGYKQQFTPSWSAAIILDQPFGAGIDYPATQSIALGGTKANVDSLGVTGIVRFAAPGGGFGAHGGVRALRTSGDVTLSGAAYGAVSGYQLDTGTDTAYGWLAGVSWERPDIAARVTLTYNSEIEHDFDAREEGPQIDLDGDGPGPILPVFGSVSELTVKMPKSLNLEFQTGVAADTLVFGSIRWADWSSFRVDPQTFVAVTGGGLVEIDDSTTYTFGAARKITDNWSGAASLSFEKAGDDLVSPLAPTNGRTGITLAAIYSQDKFKVTTGISYVKLGDAMPETGTPDEARAVMKDNSALGIGVKVGYSF